MKDPYSVLGVSKNATNDEIKEAYHALARKYHPDNYGDDNPLKELANEKMQEVNTAYDQIQRERAGGGAYKGEGTYYGNDGGTGSSSGVYYEIRKDINAKRFRDAEAQLAAVPAAERTAEWHYLNSVLLMRRGAVNDAMRELEIACSMDPSNMEYRAAFNQLERQRRTGGYRAPGPMGAGCSGCDVCQSLICADCCCECMGGDLIRCC